MMPATGVRPPLRTLVAVRAMTPVQGMPPKIPIAMFATPCPISSWFESCRSSIMPSATTADSRDSIAPSTATVIAAGTSACHASNDSAGQCGAGKVRGKSPNREPSVAMENFSFRWKIASAIVARTTITIDPGRNFPSFFGQNQIASVQTVANQTVGQLTWKCGSKTSRPSGVPT